jgi:hypothetical protein
MWQLCCCNRDLKYRFRTYFGVANAYGYRAFEPGGLAYQFNTNDPAFPTNTWLNLSGVPITNPTVQPGEWILVRQRANTTSPVVTVVWQCLTATAQTPAANPGAWRNLTNPQTPALTGIFVPPWPLFTSLGSVHQWVSGSAWGGNPLPRFTGVPAAGALVRAGTLALQSGIRYLALSTFTNPASAPPLGSNPGFWVPMGVVTSGTYLQQPASVNVASAGRFTQAIEHTELVIVRELSINGGPFSASNDLPDITAEHRRMYQMDGAPGGVAIEEMVEYTNTVAELNQITLTPFGQQSYEIGLRNLVFPACPAEVMSASQTETELTIDARTPWITGNTETVEGVQYRGRARVVATIAVSLQAAIAQCQLPVSLASDWTNRYQFATCMPGGTQSCTQFGLYRVATQGSALEVESNCHYTVNGIEYPPGTVYLRNNEIWCPDTGKPCNTPTA